jgi:hypothetical protein
MCQSSILLPQAPAKHPPDSYANSRCISCERIEFDVCKIDAMYSIGLGRGSVSRWITLRAVAGEVSWTRRKSDVSVRRAISMIL